MYESLAFHVFFFKQKTAYEVRISDWSSDVCSSDLLPRMRAVAPDASVRFEEIAAFPGLAAREDDPATALVKRLTGADAADKVSFGTEAGLFQAAGIPAVVCGPGRIEQAHKPDEYIEVDQMARCEAFLSRLAASPAA